MITSANIVAYDGYNLIVRPRDRIGRELSQKQVNEVEIRIVDGREISAEQRRKIYAVIRDIAFWCGDNPEWISERCQPEMTICLQRLTPMTRLCLFTRNL